MPMATEPLPPGVQSAPGVDAHGPPPSLPPLNTHTAHGTALSGAALDALSPTSTGEESAGGTIRRAAPEPNKRALYVGGLDQRVTEDVLKQIFETSGHVQNVKIIPDKNMNSKGFNYGFVEFDDPSSAQRAMDTLNGRRIHHSEIRVNWAYQSNTVTKEDTSTHFHIFVGDLSNEVNDEVLLQAFSAFGEVSEARVMWDMKTGRSRGYGFVAYKDRTLAEKALSSMDGEWLGSRAIRCNWANQKGQPSVSQQQAVAQMGITPTTSFGHHQFPTHGEQSYEMIVQQTPQFQTTTYVGNLTPYTTQNDLVPLFQNFGFVVEARFQSDRGFAFIKMDTHENAAMAICQLNGYNIHGRPLKCSWGKDRAPPQGGQFEGYSPHAPGAGFTQPSPPAQYFPQYGQPAPQAMSPQGPPQSAGGYGHAASPAGYGQPYGGQPQPQAPQHYGRPHSHYQQQQPPPQQHHYPSSSAHAYPPQGAYQYGYGH